MLVYIIFIMNSGRTSKKTLHFTIISISLLMLFREIILVYAENHTRPINTKYTVTYWFLKDMAHTASTGFKGLITCAGSVDWTVVKAEKVPCYVTVYWEFGLQFNKYKPVIGAMYFVRMQLNTWWIRTLMFVVQYTTVWFIYFLLYLLGLSRQYLSPLISHSSLHP
jgi:hypothetical protein